MTATQNPTRISRKSTESSRPIQAVLLELAYQLHTTKVVAHVQTPAPADWRPRKSR